MIPSASSLASSTVRELTAATYKGTLEPLPDCHDVAAQDGGRLAHVDPERAVDGWMTDAKTENEPPTGRIGDERCALRTDIRMTQIDVRNPRPDGDTLGRGPHELSRRHHVVVHLGREDRVEPGALRLAGNRLHVRGAPAHSRNHCEPESFSHRGLLSSYLSRVMARAPARCSGLFGEVRRFAGRDATANARLALCGTSTDTKKLAG
jgi:hypothetical protein